MGTADCLKTWLVTGTSEGETVSMAVYNDKGYYGVGTGIVFSFPCECKNGEWSVKEGLKLSKLAQEKLDVSEKELMEERDAARELLDTTASTKVLTARKRSVSNVSSFPSLTASESEMSFSTSAEAPMLMSKI